MQRLLIDFGTYPAVLQVLPARRVQFPAPFRKRIYVSPHRIHAYDSRLYSVCTILCVFSGKNFTGRKTALRNIPGTVRPPRSLQNYITRLTMYLRSPALPAEAYNGKIQNIYNSSKKCRRKNQWKAYLRKNNNQTEIEPIDYFYPNATNLANTLVNDCTINGKKTYVRVLIRKKVGA